MKRCSNCGKYPFCTKCESPTGYCEEFIKVPYSIKVKDWDELFDKIKEVQ